MGAIGQRDILRYCEQLVIEGQQVLSTKYSSGNYVRGRGDVPTPLYVKQDAMAKWLAGCRNLVYQIGESAGVWNDAFVESNNHLLSVVETAFARLNALEEAIRFGMLTKILRLAEAEVFGSLMEQAEHLVDSGYTLAAGVLCRAVLEEHLRNACYQRGCMPSTPRPALSALNVSLYTSGVIDKIAMKEADCLASIGNHCAHNEHPPQDEQTVRSLIDRTAQFLARYL